MPHTSLNSIRLKAGAIAVCTFLLYYALGIAIEAGMPAFDQLFLQLEGHGIGLAIVFSTSANLVVLCCISVVSLLLGIFYRAWLLRCSIGVACDSIGWLVSDFGKTIFHRARPEHWVYHHETSFSYASGHSLHALIVYGLWSFFFWRSALPLYVRIPLCSVLAAWVFAVGWSRMALGAHFASDVIGGYLLSISLIACAVAIVPQILEIPGRTSTTKL